MIHNQKRFYADPHGGGEGELPDGADPDDDDDDNDVSTKDEFGTRLTFMIRQFMGGPNNIWVSPSGFTSAQADDLNEAAKNASAVANDWNQIAKAYDSKFAADCAADFNGISLSLMKAANAAAQVDPIQFDYMSALVLPEFTRHRASDILDISGSIAELKGRIQTIIDTFDVAVSARERFRGAKLKNDIPWMQQHKRSFAQCLQNCLLNGAIVKRLLKDNKVLVKMYKGLSKKKFKS